MFVKRVNKNNIHSIKIIEVDEFRPFISDLHSLTLSNFTNVYFIMCNYNSNHFCSRSFQIFGCIEPLLIFSAVKKRRAEYLAGRVVSMFALKLSGQNNVQVMIGEGRSPVWPEGVRGSITHTDDRACAIVGVSDQYQYIGVDCEKIISAETAVEIVQVILNSTERRRINKRTEEFAFLVTLVFSAKEAIFKALYPHVKKYFDFYAVELIQLCLKSDFIIFKLQKSLTPSLQKGMKFQLYFTFDQTHITTWLIT